MDGMIVTGTGTDVGKTVCAALLVRALGGSYWKPIQSGTLEGYDRDRVRALSGLGDAHFFKEAYCLKAPLSPHRAAFLEGVEIDLDKIPKPTPQNTPLVIEGAGGLLVPITQEHLMVDLFARFELPLVLCARTDLGTINHTLLSLEAIEARRLPLLGVVFLGDGVEDTMDVICSMGKVPKIGHIPHLQSLSGEALDDVFDRYFDHRVFL